MIFFVGSLSSYAQYDSIFVDGNYRSYLLHLPINYSPDSIYPLVLAMHGGFGNGPQLEEQSQLSEKADQEGFIVVYPEGSMSFLSIRTWNAGNCCGYSSNQDIDDVGFLDALMDSIIDNYSVDEYRIYATGMSNGAMMSYRLACELSDRIAAIAPVAGSMVVSDCLAENEIPIIHFHSYLDSNVPYEGGVGDGFSDHYNPPLDSIFNFWSGINNCQLSNDTIYNDSTYTHVIWDNCDCSYSIEYIITHDGGHSWPGGNQSTIGDPVSEYINANDKMWEFFMQYSLECDQNLAISETPESKQGVKIYPNPTNGKIIIVGKELNHLTVFNSLGQVYLDMEIHPSDMLNISLEGESLGHYFFHVSYDVNKKDMIKVILQD